MALRLIALSEFVFAFNKRTKGFYRPTPVKFSRTTLIVHRHALAETENEVIDAYFALVAANGRPTLSWARIQRAVIWKLEV